MLKSVQTIFWLSFFLLSSYGGAEESLHPRVLDYIQLLVRTEEPTLAEYVEITGESECGGETELEFELDKCYSKNWSLYSKACGYFTRQRCESAEQAPALKLGWFRRRFSTVGERYRLINIQSKSGHDLIEVEIGKNRFLLVQQTDLSISMPPGFLIYVSKVNGKEIVDFGLPSPMTIQIERVK